MNEKLDELINIANGISNGEIPEYQHNECFTSGAFDLLLVNAHEGDAFDLLSELCNRITSAAYQPDRLKGVFLLAHQLAEQTKTTEMPNGMEKMINSNLELSKGLRQWYRYSG